MKSYVGRAIQISYMEKEAIQKLQEIENEKKYIIPNWNIQSIFMIPSIKERYKIPEENDAQAIHSTRIEKELLQKEIVKTGFFYESDVDWMHAFDWSVFKNAHKIVWDYVGQVKNKRGRSILSELEE